VVGNREYWNDQAPDYAAWADRAWTSDPTWGIWHIPEAEIGLLAGVGGKSVLEDGCGTAYISAYVAAAGGKPVGLDNSPAQLATARHMQEEHDLSFPLVQGIAEQLPFRDASFDMVISEYGAAIWSDPYRWIPEAARVLKPGGELTFLGNSSLLMLCVPDHDGEPAGPELLRDHFGMHRFDWPEIDDDGVEFHLGHGDRIRLLRDAGFEILDLIELRAPEGATTAYDFVTADWAHRWPSEEIWRARKRP
jgi:SAM-dependent methyltransferase